MMLEARSIAVGRADVIRLTLALSDRTSFARLAKV
jgi:hypothetical protein